ncbi:hypothetical protein GSI_10372 [Ganoderma sinense ZZ0214-1]|uniref:Uncharacterized protein n=1 Tax=Ganoderma sinense ZZ0214-1 TaxID=1077348 RepID=A0A2G8S0Z5_9APHY|nr:hypothetical protein GSI_10372 [Ganoderma sinense ZZ0214-1]
MNDLLGINARQQLGFKAHDGSGSSRTAEMSHVEISLLTAAVRRRYVSLSSLPVVQDFDNQDDEWMDMDMDNEDNEDNLRMGNNASDGGRCSTDKDLEETMDVDDQEDHMDVDGPPSRTSPGDVSGCSLRKRKCPVVMSPEDSSDDEMYDEGAMVPPVTIKTKTKDAPFSLGYTPLWQTA